MRKLLAVLAVWLMMCTVLVTGCFDKDVPSDRTFGGTKFDSVGWERMSVADKATFVGFDPDSFLDDYAYLASVPASVFHDEASAATYAHPLMFYNDPYQEKNKEERTYNDYQGLDYFMQDLRTAAKDFDIVEFVNMDEGQIDHAEEEWIGGNSSDTIASHAINGEDPYSVAAEIALFNWEYSEEAVVVPVEEEYPFEKVETSGSVTGTTPNKDIMEMRIEGTKVPNPVEPNDHDFKVEDGYKYVKAVMTWGADWEPEMVRQLLERGKDPDLQLYDMEIGQVAASENWNPLTGPIEEIGSYAYHSGDWRASVTYMPTEQILSLDEDREKLEELREELADGTWDRSAADGGGEDPGGEDGVGGDGVGGDGVGEDPGGEDGVGEDPGGEDGVGEDPGGEDGGGEDGGGEDGVGEDGVREEGGGEDGVGERQFSALQENEREETGDHGGMEADDNSEADYTIDLTIYPGVDIPLPEEASFSTRNAEFVLESDDPSQRLGLIIVGPSGAEIAVDISDKERKVINLAELGMGSYTASIVSLTEDSEPTDFTVSYSWEQTRSEEEGLALTSAAQGAVAASMFNAPLLFVRSNGVPEATREALDILGVEKAILVDLNGYASSGLKEKIEDYRSFLQTGLEVKEYSDLGGIYSLIKDASMMNGSRSNDVVFTTVNPWSPWLGSAAGPEEEKRKAFYIGPGAYAAAFHGTPPIIPDSSPELSPAQAWHNQFWRDAYSGRKAPSVACMYLTGKRVYDHLAKHGLDLPNEQESILTVAGQFDIGTAWDRVFTTVAYPGRIMGTPVDTSYWVSRSAFYPYVIYANPAVNPELDEHDGKRRTGSSSRRVAGALQITKPEREVKVENPILETWVSYQHRFNERAAEYWGCPYTTRTGITPYYTDSPDPIDKGLRGKYPDISTSEIVSYYSEKGGFDEVFTTNFPSTMENLNRGVIMWYEVMHGGARDGGIVGFWNTDQRESNPWRGYEENGVPLVSIGGDGLIGANPLKDMTRLRGSTENPDVVTMSKYYGLDLQPSTGPKTGAGVIPETHDGVIIAILQQGQTGLQDGYMWDEALENIHSVGFSAGSCLIANTYLHLTTVRHGSAFQIIDPWLTSWYSSFAMEMFAKDQALGGYTVGQSYVRGITHVGIQYLIEDGGWWDIFENLVYYGDPDLVMYTPQNAWAKPEPLPAGTSVNGHNFYGASDHPREIGSITSGWIIAIVLVILGGIMTGIYIYRKKNQDRSDGAEQGEERPGE